MTTRPDHDLAVGEEELLEVRRRRLLPFIVLGVLALAAGLIVKIATTHSGSAHAKASPDATALSQTPQPSTSNPAPVLPLLVPGAVASADYHPASVVYVASLQSTSAATLMLAGPVQVRTDAGAPVHLDYAGLLSPGAASALRPPHGAPPPLTKVAPHQLVDLVLVIPVSCSAASTRAAERAAIGPTIFIWFTDQAPVTLTFDDALGGYAGMLKSDCAG
jgi:hypothetical protein